MEGINRLVNIPKLLVVLGSFLAGCGTGKQVDADIVWPSPPDEPRIRYVQSYYNEDQYKSGFSKITESIAGKEGRVQLQRPFDVCVDSAGDVIVSDIESGIVVFDEVNKEVRVLGEKSSLELKRTLGIACSNEAIFVGLAGIGQVVALSFDGIVIRTYGRPGQFPNPVDVAYDWKGKRVVIVDNKIHQVTVYSETGDSLLAIGTRGEGDGEFNFPQSVAVDTAGNFYVVDAMNFRVQEFDSRGKFLRKFGEQGSIFGTFSRPKGIALDSYGNIYIADAVHNNFQIFNNAFELLLFVGRYSTSGDNLGFENPIGMYIDTRDRIYVADQLNNRIQVFQLLKLE